MAWSMRKLFTNQYDNVPIQNIIRDGTPTHTTDVLRLQQRANWLVFLYCDMQHKHPRAIDQSDLVWEGFTKDHYTMWKNDLGKLSHPVLFDFDRRLSSVSHNKVRGEVVRMRTNRLIELDAERQNGVQFQRVRVQISVPHFALVPDKGHTSILRKFEYQKGDYVKVPCEQLIWAWMYISKPDFWLEDLRKVSKIKVTTAGRRNDEALLVLDNKVVSSAKRHLPNNENNEPYYYFAPTECS